MRRAWVLLLLLWCLSVPCAGVSGAEELKQALPEETYDILSQVEAGGTDVKSGVSALWQGAVSRLRTSLKSAMESAFLMAAVCLLLSLLQSFAGSAGLRLPGRTAELAGTTAILLIALGDSGTLVGLCRQTLERLETFTELLIGVFAAASAVAGHPASAVATAGAAMLFSQLVLTLSRKVFLPAVTMILLLSYGGILTENGALRQAAAVGKWAVTTFFRVFLAAYFGYLTFTGLVSGSADAAAVRTAQGFTSAVPLVGTIIAGASETLLSGASVLRAGVGLLGALGAAAICLTPFLQGVCHLLVFRVLSVFAASFAEGGVKALLDALSGVYGMLVGILTACCAVQFLTIVVSMAVTSA